MEIMIRIKNRTFSVGHKGFRKVSHMNWKNAYGAFEALVRFQTGKMVKDQAKLEAHIKEKRAEWAEQEESGLVDPAYQGDPRYKDGPKKGE